MIPFTLFPVLLLVWTDAQTVFRGSSTHLSAEWLGELRDQKGCRFLFLARTTSCGRIIPASFICQNIYSAVYQHLGCSGVQDVVYFIVSGENVGLRLRALTVRVLSRPVPLVTVIGNVNTKRGGRSKPFGIRIARENGSYCVFGLRSPIPGVASGLYYGDVDGLETPIRYSCQLGKQIGLVYKHLGVKSREDVIPFTVWFADENRRKLKVEYDSIWVGISDSSQNAIPQLSSSSSLTLLVQQLSVTPILPSNLAAVDEDDVSNDLIISFSSGFDPRVTGVVFSLDNPFPVYGDIVNVTQSEIKDGKVAYRPPVFGSPRSMEFPFDIIDPSGSRISSKLTVLLMKRNEDIPYVTVNEGLVVKRGGRGVINASRLMIGSDHGLAVVALHVTHHPLAGKLIVLYKGVQGDASDILVEDLEKDRLFYESDNSVITDSDRVIFEVSDGVSSFHCYFMVWVYDTEPKISVLPTFTAHRNQAIMISDEVINIDCPGCDVMFTLDQGKPLRGRLYLRGDNDSIYVNTSQSVDNLGQTRITEVFFQADITEGRVWYVPPQNKAIERVSLTFNASTSSSWQSVSLEINILHKIDEGLRLAKGISLMLMVREKSTIVLTSTAIRFVSRHSNRADIKYVMTDLPSFVSSEMGEDAGKIVWSSRINEVAYEFSQEDIAKGRISYMTPVKDSGLKLLIVQFRFRVFDKTSVLYSQLFTIEIEPVDDMLPEIIQDEDITVEENASVIISSSHMRGVDIDTPTDQLQFRLLDVPRHGVLIHLNHDLNLTVGDTFTMVDVNTQWIVYHHTGHDHRVSSDQFAIKLSDGHHSVVATVSILIGNAKVPRLIDSISYRMSIDALQTRILVGHESLLVIDHETPDNSIMYILKTSPKFGAIELKSHGIFETITVFNQADIIANRLYYRVINPQYLSANVTETLLFTVGQGRQTLNVEFEVNIVIPDSQALSVVMASPFGLLEGGNKVIEVQHLNVTGATEQVLETKFIVRNYPHFGNLSVRGLTGIAVSSFTLMDIQLMQVTYIQFIHQEIEPTHDSFIFDITDGLARLSSVLFNITIYPANDELPVVIKGYPDPLVSWKENLTISPDFLRIVDSDVGSTDTELSIQLNCIPQHGYLSLFTEGDNEGKRLKETDLLTMDDIRNLKIVYTHDGSPSHRDLFNFSVSDGNYIVDDYLEIQIYNPNIHKPVVINNTGLVVLQVIHEVLISSLNLSVEDEDSQPSELHYTIISLPAFGTLKIQAYQSGKKLVTLLQTGSHFTQLNIDHGHVFYTHDGHNIGLATFVFSVSDGKNEIGHNHFHIRVKHLDTEPPVVVTNKGLTVKAKTAAVISPSLLNVKDNIATSSELTFHVVNSVSVGFFSMVGSIDEPIHIFSQADIDATNVSFVNSAGPSSSLSDTVVFSVSDMSNEINVNFIIHITPDPAFLPRLVNKGMYAFRHEEKTLDSSSISLIGSNSPNDDIIFTIMSLPLYGHLTLFHGNNSKVRLPSGGSFTQHDLISSQVKYKFLYQERAADEDLFVFRVFDPGYLNYTLISDQQSKLQSFSSHQTFIISIITVDLNPPVMIANKGLDYLLLLETGQIGRPLSIQELQAGDDITDQSDLKYIVRDEPKHGKLCHRWKHEVVHFRQKDINEGFIVYVLKDKSLMTQDSFSFSVIDKNGNILEGQMFNISWAYLTMEPYRLKVKERDETVNVTIRRTGNIDIQIFFTCQTESGTALEALAGTRPHEGNADFDPVSMLYTLAPGDMTTQCVVPLKDDQKYERMEVFNVKVVHPMFAFLGEPSNVEITVVDPEDEPVFGFDTTNVSVSEDVGDMELLVRRTGDLTDTLSVICYTESGSATGSTSPYLLTGDDYVTKTNSQHSKIVFNSGVSTKVCSVRILDDTLEEGPEVFSVHLITHRIGAKLDENKANVYVTINGPNDESTVQFSSPSYHVNESSGHITITIQLVGPDLSFPVSVWLTTKDESPISAQNGEDYIHLSRLVEFSPHSRQQAVQVKIIDDDVEEGHPVLEGPETFIVMLVSATTVGIGELNEATIIIDDSEDIAVVGFSVSSIVINEGPLLELNVNRSGATNFLTTVRCYTISGSAEKGTDFVDRPSTDMSIIKFEKGEVSQKCYVVILDDDQFEGQETFSVLLDRPSDGTRLGIAGVHVIIRDPQDVPSIQFESVAVTVSEPISPNQYDRSVLTLALQRTGDLRMISSIQFFTQDESAQSGQDYKALLDTVTFNPFERRKTVSVDVLFDLEKELGETFFGVISLLPLSLNVQLGNRQRVSITITDFAPSGVSFLLRPKVLSLLEYGKHVDGNSSVTSGYPAICVSSCDIKFGKHKALDHCHKEMIDHSKTKYRWEVAEPGAFSHLQEVTFASPFTNHSSVTLDSAYFKPGGQVRCYATPINSKGVAGVEMASHVVTVSEQGFCYPRSSSQLDPDEIETQMRYVGGIDGPKSSTVETFIRLPHIDGYIPLVSTHSLENLGLTLTIPSARSVHACSNMVMGDEQNTVYGFIQPFTPGSGKLRDPGFNNPHQLDTQYRDIATLTLYQYLDLEECHWTFQTWFTVSELLNTCGAQISKESTRNITITTPLYISYVHFSASTVWQYLSDISSLAVSLSGSLANPAITQNINEYTNWGQIYSRHMYIRQSDEKLEMHFLSIALFRGQFVMSHPSSVYLSHVDAPNGSVPFDLELLDSEPTVHRVKQKWRIISKYSLPHYVGKYGLVLLPCKVARHVQWSYPISHICTPGNPIEFYVRVDFPEIFSLSPQPASHGLNTLFKLSHNLQGFLRDASLTGNHLELKANHYFRKAETIYGWATIDPSQAPQESFYLIIESVYLCAGRDGYVPSYDPANKHYGCLEPSVELAHRLKILDRDYPNTTDVAFQNVPLEAEFASDNSSYNRLNQRHSVDGFTLMVAPLYAATPGYSWYLQIVYSIKGSSNTMTRTKQGKSKAHKDNNTEPLAKLGTAIKDIQLFGDYEDQPTLTAQPANKGDIRSSKSTALAITLGIAVPFIFFLLIILLVVIWIPQRRETANESDNSTEKPTDTRKVSTISIDHGNNPYLASFLHVCSDTEENDVDLFDSAEEDPFDSDEEVCATDGQTVDLSDTNASSVKSEDYSGDISDDHNSYQSSHFKRFSMDNGQWRANDGYVTTL